MWRLAPPKRGLYSGSGRIFASPIGKPIDPRRDWEEWKRVLADAGVRDARLHDARHTAATFLLVAGVDTRTVMDLLGWSQPILTVRYQHVVDELKQEAVVKFAAARGHRSPCSFAHLPPTFPGRGEDEEGCGKVASIRFCHLVDRRDRTQGKLNHVRDFRAPNQHPAV